MGIVGLGYVGLPLAVEFAKAGFTVTGIDVTESKVERINRGESYVKDVPTAELGPLVDQKRLLRPLRISPPSPDSTPSTSACPRRCARPRTPT